MPVVEQKHGLALASKITATGKILIPGEPELDFICSIDPTFIRINDPLHERFWTVDPCLALSQGGSFLFISHLPAEPCELKVSFSEGLYMVAYAIPAFTDIQLPDGRRLKGTINFPDAISKHIEKGLWLVGKVETGTKTPDYFNFLEPTAA